MDINALLAEFLGTFIFVSVILITGNPYMICLTLLIVILLASSLSGGHINPAVSTAMFLNGSIDYTKYLGYVSAQILGGTLAYLVYTHTK